MQVEPLQDFAVVLIWCSSQFQLFRRWGIPEQFRVKAADLIVSFVSHVSKSPVDTSAK